MKKIPKVGIFDSGIGGLTVLGACERLLPDVKFYYLGDNGNAPYGSRSEREITNFVYSALKEFQSLGVDAAVLACNTATAVCADLLRREFSFPIVGMEPAVRPAAKQCKSALVLCTPKTAESARLRGLIARFPQSRFTVFPAPQLAAAIEKHLTYAEPLTLSDHLPALKSLPSTCDPKWDGVVLGCTHYLFFRQKIADFYALPVFDGNEGTAKRVKNLLNLGNGDHFDVEILGQTDHRNERVFDNKSGEHATVFLGKWSELNKKAYNANVCFQNFL